MCELANEAARPNHNREKPTGLNCSGWREADSEVIRRALREKPLKLFDVMRRANISNEETCQSLLLKMRDEGSVKFIFTRGDGLSRRKVDLDRSVATQIVTEVLERRRFHDA